MQHLKLRFRRRFRRGQKQVEGFGQQAEVGLEKHFFKRLSNLSRVWRFVLSWVGLLLLIGGLMVYQLEGLGDHYQTTQPVAGGTYTEGLSGSFTNANPLYATSEVDTAVSKLLFASLFSYDQNNKLVGDLAESWQANDLGTAYTVKLKPNLRWQDGQPLTASDVVFTYHAIQNPDAQSSLAASWQGITVTKTDEQTIVFTLPNPLSSFQYNLTNGIIPEHSFASLDAAEWRSSDFNTAHPIGAGPFKWSALQVEGGGSDNAQTLIALQPFDQYQGGKPQLGSFVFHIFRSRASLINSFKAKQLTAISVSAPPADLVNDNSLQQEDFLISGATMAFFNTTMPELSDAQVRRALVQGTDTASIIKQLGFNTRAVKEPLLSGQIGYDAALAQLGYDPAAAKQSLDKAGWKLDATGKRMKSGQPLKITLYAADTPEYRRVGQELNRDWQALGIQTDFQAQTPEDFQSTINSRNYDVVLNSIAIGPDPDVFVYWDSSQTDPRSTRLNLSEYKSATADAALEAGRTRLDPALRAAKYKPFLQAWQQDAPAVGLYQPHYVYISQSKIYGLDSGTINSTTDRFNNVQAWMIRTAKVSN